MKKHKLLVKAIAFICIFTLSLTTLVSASNYAPGDKITVDAGRYKQTDSSWVGFYKSGAQDKSYLSYKYIKDLPNGQYSVEAPKELGSYEFRFFKDSGYTKIATSPTYQIGQHSPTISLNASSFKPDQTITASYVNASSYSDAWIGFYKSGSSDKSYISYEYLKGSSGQYSIKAPKEAGQYEFRIFLDSGYTPLASSQMLTVSTTTPTSLTPSQQGTNLNGQWDINANNHIGIFNITNQRGSEFTGTIVIDGTRVDNLTNGSIKGDQVSFTRQWFNSSFKQDYTGTLAMEDGIMTMKGTFTPSGSGYSNWTASKKVAETPKPKPIPTPAPPKPAPTGNNAQAFESGARVMWSPARGLGYRLFRSTSKSELGISVTDFYITSTSYADVNVEANTSYYYTVKPVLAEARPFEGIDEKLGDTIATYVVTTGGNIYKPGSFKHFIMLKLESPYMSVDGISQEVDPGRGTMPVVINGRTMVPIRAIVEAMGGSAEWDGPTQKITLKARGSIVEMWLGKKDIRVNGQSKQMDIAPTTKNARTFVPVRFAAENIDCKVDWINSTQEAVIVYVD